MLSFNGFDRIKSSIEREVLKMETQQQMALVLSANKSYVLQASQLKNKNPSSSFRGNIHIQSGIRSLRTAWRYGVA